MKQQDALRACGCSTVLIMTGEHGGRAMLQDTVKFKTEEEEFDITVNGYISGKKLQKLMTHSLIQLQHHC